MYVSKLSLNCIRGFIGPTEIKFSRNLNIFVGPNNSGKSTLLNSILLLQKNVFQPSDISINQTAGRIEIFFENYQRHKQFMPINESFGELDSAVHLVLDIRGINEIRYSRNADRHGGNPYYYAPVVEPDNLIYPYLSKRKVSGYSENVNSDATLSVTGDLYNLYAKVDRISNQYFLPAHEEYHQACMDILGFPITTTSSPSGKKAAWIIKNLQSIPLTSMGEGVASLLGLIVDLCVAEDQIFLIEEPENDIHPKALKALLNLIVKKSENNQFFISTHSNIVTKYLGGQRGSRIFKVQMQFSPERGAPVSTVDQISENEQDRRLLLEELGYEFHDYDLWKAWLFLEESSAEEIVRDYLVPMFTPSLRGKLRTFSARSLSEMESKFKDFNNLFVFLHLEPVYKNKVWVIVDAGAREKEIIDKMMEYYQKSGWDPEQFRQFSQHDFENFYPAIFAEKVTQVLAIQDRTEKRTQKSALLVEVKEWIKGNRDEAYRQLSASAGEIIELLKLIEARIGDV